jgi:hypothetical protein
MGTVILALTHGRKREMIPTEGLTNEVTSVGTRASPWDHAREVAVNVPHSHPLSFLTAHDATITFLLGLEHMF